MPTKKEALWVKDIKLPDGTYKIIIHPAKVVDAIGHKIEVFKQAKDPFGSVYWEDLHADQDEENFWLDIIVVLKQIVLKHVPSD